jgi:hypothetical protein
MIRLWQTWKTLGVLCVLTAIVLVLIASGGLEPWATAQTPAAGSGGTLLLANWRDQR